MTKTTAQRMLDLWSILPPDKQDELLAIAEKLAGSEPSRVLSDREVACIAQSREDFATGRTYAEDDYRREMGDFYERLSRSAIAPK